MTVKVSTNVTVFAHKRTEVKFSGAICPVLSRFCPAFVQVSFLGWRILTELYEHRVIGLQLSAKRQSPVHISGSHPGGSAPLRLLGVPFLVGCAVQEGVPVALLAVHCWASLPMWLVLLAFQNHISFRSPISSVCIYPSTVPKDGQLTQLRM